MDEESVVRIHNRILLSYKKSKTVPFAEVWIDLETVIQRELSQKGKNKYQTISRKMVQMNLFAKKISCMWDLEKWYR